MKTVATIFLGLIVGIASLVCFLSSICTVSSGMTSHDRTAFALITLVSLGIAIGGVVAIGKINRTQ